MDELGTDRRGFMGGVAAGTIGLGLNSVPHWANSNDTVDLPELEERTDLFLDVDGVEGSAVDKDHADEIEILAWQFGMERSTDTRTRRGSGGPAFDRLFVGKAVDKASPQLMTSFASGDVHEEATLTTTVTVGTNPADWITVGLKDVQVTDLTDFATETFLPLEEVHLTFGEISVTVVEFDDKGSQADEWVFDWKIE